MNSISARWKERREAYIKAEEEAKKEEETPLDGMIEAHKQSMETCSQEVVTSSQKALYTHIADDSLQKNSSDALLLPSLPNLTIPVKELKGVERVDFIARFQLEQEKTKRALEQVKFYRNLAEKLRIEKRTSMCALNDKIELVRDFWRKKIFEGSTRAGKIVQNAIRK